MEKRRMLFLIPMIGLFLTGCDAKSVLKSAKSWISNNIYHPAIDFIDNALDGGKKEEEKPAEEEQKEEEQSGDKEDEGGEEGGEGDTPEPEVIYDLVLDKKEQLEVKDEGYLYQADLDGLKVDFIGFESNEETLGSIKKVTYGTQSFDGMIYNRSLMNGLDKLLVTFSGGSLQYVFSEYLMEDMDFASKTGNEIESGKALEVPQGKGYFVLYNKSESPARIESLKFKFEESKQFDAKAIYNKETPMGGARSLAKRCDMEDSYIELENNPTKTTNNYSVGKNAESGRNNSWYRWNGKFFRDSETLGTSFKLGMTVMGNLSQVVDESKYFHYAVWPQMGWKEGDTLHSGDNNYVQTYIGNDNYEPLGKDNALRPSDPYVNESYAGRFFTDYGWYNNNWEFANPDTTLIADGESTFREAYERYSLPFWFIEFDFSLNEDDMPICDVYINGFHLFSQEIFDEGDYDTVNKPGLQVHSMPMHLVNYGIDAEGNPAPSYTGCFTYPRLMTK